MRHYFGRSGGSGSAGPILTADVTLEQDVPTRVVGLGLVEAERPLWEGLRGCLRTGGRLHVRRKEITLLAWDRRHKYSLTRVAHGVYDFWWLVQRDGYTASFRAGPPP